MFLIGMAILDFVLSLFFLTVDGHMAGRDKFFIGLFFLLGAVYMAAGMHEFSSPHMNKTLYPLRMKNGDTLYVAPKNGFQGAAIIVGRDSTGHETIVVRSFVAQHTIAAAIK